MSKQDSQSELGNILDDLVNMKKPARFHNTDWAEYAIEAYVTTRVKEALEAARSKDPHLCQFGHKVYSHKTVDGWCCACEADQAFMEAEIEARVKEAELLARIDELNYLISKLNGGIFMTAREIRERIQAITTTTNGKEEK